MASPMPGHRPRPAPRRALRSAAAPCAHCVPASSGRWRDTVATKRPRTRKAQPTSRSTEDRPEHPFAVLLEDVNAKLTGLAEGQIAMGESLRREMRDGFAEQGARIGRVESAVVAHSGEIRALATRVGAVESGLVAVQSQLGAVASKLDTKADASRLDALEARAR